MVTWSTEEAQRITAPEEVQVTTRRRDGSLAGRPPSGSSATVSGSSSARQRPRCGLVPRGRGHRHRPGRRPGTTHEVRFTRRDPADLGVVDAATATSTAATPRSSTTSRSPAPRAATPRRCDPPPDPATRTKTHRRRRPPMRGTIIHGTRDIRFEERPDPTIASRPTPSCAPSRPASAGPTSGATAASSRSRSRRRSVTSTSASSRPSAPTSPACAGRSSSSAASSPATTPARCRAGAHANCLNGTGYDGCQAELIRVQNADGTLLATPEQPDDAMVPSVLALSDVMCTGWHAAVSRRRTPRQHRRRRRRRRRRALRRARRGAARRGARSSR